MGFFKDLFRKSDVLSNNNNTNVEVDVTCDDAPKNGNNSGEHGGDKPEITLSGGYIGDLTGSTQLDFYVYEWYIKESGEVFYVGKGRGDRYKERHERAYEAEKIRDLYETDVKFVATGLSEEEALELETNEMVRILNETNDRLTNRFIPFFTKRDNGYSRSQSTPTFEFERAPILFACEIDEHYFGIKGRPFDIVDVKNLSHPFIIDKGIDREIIDIVYGGNYKKYYQEVVSLLEKYGSKLLKTKYAKSVSCWIYPGDDYVTNYDIDEKAAEERIGRHIPCYHLLDVRRALQELIGQPESPAINEVEIHPVNNRVPLSQIKNLHDWDAGFSAGFRYWEKGDAKRKSGDLDEALSLFDKARLNGYFAPALYDSYAKAYRKLKDLDNEIDILNEAIDRTKAEYGDESGATIKYEEARQKAIMKLLKSKNKKNS